MVLVAISHMVVIAPGANALPGHPQEHHVMAGELRLGLDFGQAHKGWRSAINFRVFDTRYITYRLVFHIAGLLDKEMNHTFACKSANGGYLH